MPAKITGPQCSLCIEEGRRPARPVHLDGICLMHYKAQTEIDRRTRAWEHSFPTIVPDLYPTVPDIFPSEWAA